MSTTPSHEQRLMFHTIRHGVKNDEAENAFAAGRTSYKPPSRGREILGLPNATSLLSLPWALGS